METHEVGSCPTCSDQFGTVMSCTVVRICWFCHMEFDWRHGFKVGWCSEQCWKWNRLMKEARWRESVIPTRRKWEKFVKENYPTSSIYPVPKFEW